MLHCSQCYGFLVCVGNFFAASGYMSPLLFSPPYVPSVHRDIYPGATRPEHETNFHVRLQPGSQMHCTPSPLPRTAIRCTASVQGHSFAFPLPSVVEFPCLRYSLKLDLTALR